MVLCLHGLQISPQKTTVRHEIAQYIFCFFRFLCFCFCFGEAVKISDISFKSCIALFLSLFLVSFSNTSTFVLCFLFLNIMVLCITEVILMFKMQIWCSKTDICQRDYLIFTLFCKLRFIPVGQINKFAIFVYPYSVAACSAVKPSYIKKHKAVKQLQVL